jgi:thiamine-monophosphate kinase
MRMNENALVERIRRRFGSSKRKNPGLRVDIGDDAALFAVRDGYQVISTCDWFLEGTHFLRDIHPPDSVGWKCLARAISDIAAMGGRPKFFLLSLALPAELTGRWLDDYLGGLQRAARKFHCSLAGGDTTKGDKILISITVFGEVRSRQAVLRSGARPGDAVFVSGRLGEAELGLRLLRDRALRPQLSNPLLKKHLYPEPRLALGRWLAENRMATAMMDLSDGLSSDLPRLCAASGVGTRIDAAAIPTVRDPLKQATRSGKMTATRAKLQNLDLLDVALNGGDDYELLFTANSHQADRVPCKLAEVNVTRIGKITNGRRIALIRTDKLETALDESGWDSFRSQPVPKEKGRA